MNTHNRLSPLHFAVSSVILALVIQSSFGQALPRHEFTPDGRGYMRGEILVQFTDTVTDPEIEQAFQQGGLNLLRHVLTPAMENHGRIGITHTLTSLPIPAALRVLNNLPGVDFAEPNWIATSQAEANDPLYLDGSTWGMFSDDYPWNAGPAGTTNPFGAQAEKVWAAGMIGSPDVFVGVVDTSGIQFDHPDLTHNVWTNPGEIPANGFDDDGNGYADDVHGWNSNNDNGSVYETTESHGTHVAGTIGAEGGNAVGVAGVNWNISMISGKFGAGGSGSYLNAIEAIDYMTTLRARKGLNIVALNASWGGTSYSQALLDSITRAAQAGILLSAAAMNRTNNNDLSPFYPANYDTTTGAGYDSVISVAAIDRNGNLATFSNYGANSVDLGAPGVTIHSTMAINRYGAMSGTSMATPHVAGAVALYASTHPGDHPALIRNNLLVSVTATPSLNQVTITGGRLDANTFLASAATGLPAPSAPAGLQTVVISAGRIDLSWVDQSDNELGFAVERSADGGATFSLADTSGADFTSYSDRTVRPSSTYIYRLRAYNPGGSSDYVYSPAAVTTPYLAAPAGPASLTATAQPAGKGGGVALAWVDKSNNEDGFQLERKTGSAGTWQMLTQPAANVIKYTDLTPVSRTLYYYRLRAFNAAGVSAYSNEVSVTSK